MAQLCVDVTDEQAPPGQITVSAFYDRWERDAREHVRVFFINNVTVPIRAGKAQFCEDIQVPRLPHEHRFHTYMTLWLRGHVAGEFLNQTQQVIMMGQTQKLFIQTDKFLYQPGQTVRFRLLTMHLTNTSVSTRNYPKVWVKTPKGTRIAQWNNVDNSAGLVHLEMTLADEPLQGGYRIHVRTEGGDKETGHFEVREYSLPRFEVTVAPKKKYIASDHSIIARVCAMYTYGQPVKGSLTLEVNNFRSGSCWKSINITSSIHGCKELQIELVTMRVIDCRVNRLQLRALIEEEGTEVLLQGLSSAEISSSAFTFKKVFQSDYKKPGLPYTLKVKVERHDGTPAVNVPVEMCKGDACRNVTVPDNGMIITNVGKETFENIRMKVLHSRIMLNDASFLTDVRRYFSPSNSSLMIYTPDEELKCADGEPSNEYSLPVLFITDQAKAAITVQVISKRSIQYLKTQEFDLVPGDLHLEPDDLVEPLEEPPVGTRRGMLNIPITLPFSLHSVTPLARVLVWLVRPDGEVVADARDIKVQKCLPNKAELAWSQDVAEPGEEVEMRLTSAPNSLCSLGVVDKSSLLLDTRPKSLTLDSIFSSLESFYIPRWYSRQYNDIEHCRDQLGDVERFRSYFTRYVDSMWMFSQSGLYVFSDLRLNTRLCEVMEFPYRQSIGPGFGLVDVRGQGGIESYADSTLSSNRIAGSSPVQEGQEGRARTDFPETWLWDLYVLPDSGTYSSQLTLPDTITEWVGQAVCVHPQEGLGLSQYSNVTTFTPFFLDLTLPPSIKRGETLGVLVSVFNYLRDPLPVILKLHGSTEYDIVRDPTSQLPDGVVEVCVAGSSKVVMNVKIKPTKIGQVNITVGATVNQNPGTECGNSAPQVIRSDTLVKPITVKAEGFPREKTWNKYICADDLVDGTDSLGPWDVRAPGGIVEGSDRGWVTVVGSLLSISLENLGRLIRMPYGCGEQNMIKFAPNVFILQYLTITRQATPEVTSRLTNLMKTGYQRQLLYLRSNGSYSAFGSADDSGSTWLTAFVVKSFAQAQPFITIDSKNLRDSIKWLVETQGPDGCFPSIGKVFNRALKGGVEDRGVEALTAYVLVALLESGAQNITSATLNATSCLLNTRSSLSPYILALKAYALALAERPEAMVVLNELMARAVVTPNSTHWKHSTAYSQSNSVAVETAGYAILAMLTLDPKEYEQPARMVVKWITAQRNGGGGFYSTQDTVVALQALAKYESTQYQGDMDFVATIKGIGIDHSFAVTEDNKLVTQRAPLRTLPTSLSLTMVGSGCAVFQSVLRYNDHEPEASDTFTLSIRTQTAADKTCTTKWINLCANYVLPGQKSNMAVIEVELVSGYIPIKDDLKKAVKENPLTIKRYEVDGSKVMFYIEEFTEGQNVCLRLRVERVVEVEEAKAGSVTVYDYYEPESSVSKTYNLPPSNQCVNA